MQMTAYANGVRLRVAHVSTFPPLKCGIAFFATDLINAIPTATSSRYALHYGGMAFPDATGNANVKIVPEVVALAKSISASNCDVVAVQHEFGIWGGEFGEHLLPFLDSLSKPIVSVLHTTFPPGVRPDVQVRLLERLVEQSARVVVLTEDARRTAEKLLGRRLDHAVTILHGIPRFPFRPPPPRAHYGDSLKLVTPGFFRHDKGFEVVLKAVKQLRSKGHDLTYLIAGQPQEQFGSQAAYRGQVEQLVEDLGLREAVTLDTRFLSVDEQVACIQGAHLGVFAYQEASQASSGTLPLVLSAGRPAVCTPFEYARSKNHECHSTVVAKGFSAEDVSDTIESLIAEDKWAALSRDAYAVSAPWAWPEMGQHYLREFRRAVARGTNGSSTPSPSASVGVDRTPV